MNLAQQVLHTSFQSIYINEILSMVASYLPWTSLYRMRFWPGDCAKIVQAESRRRIFGVIERFVALDNIRNFVDLLHATDTIILGAAVRYVLLLNHPAHTPTMPSVLELATTEAMVDEWEQLLSSLGYESTERYPEASYKNRVKIVLDFERVLEDGTSTQVVLLVAKTSPLSVMIGSPTTAGMNAITSTLVVSFYPRLTFANEALQIEQVAVDDPLATAGVATFDSNSHWERPCGSYCPTKKRKPFDDDGAAIYCWRKDVIFEGDAELEWDDGSTLWGNQVATHFTYSDTLSWQVSNYCDNSSGCSYRDKLESRSQYL
ncbi:hypothetical protein EST38_g12421 [Candolleomyces aberdarensis]|uniref:Uncharacterized protein n=1 Tax=Candolleomyces aberdarensis TaxID=2316362 RepID=A0A4Q2D3K9_9AGAR|nr:hypothetical protein EST38_g12421 [Candolleomyces aberdarensis]